jgi:hypothetical protein
VKHELTKHIGVDASFVPTVVHGQFLALHYVPSELQLTDFFMKAQTRVQHGFFLSKLNGDAFCVVFPLEGIVFGDVFGRRDLWFVEVCRDGGLQEHSPHSRSVR